MSRENVKLLDPYKEYAPKEIVLAPLVHTIESVALLSTVLQDLFQKQIAYAEAICSELQRIDNLKKKEKF